jgi:hypothetical protein
VGDHEEELSGAGQEAGGDDSVDKRAATTTQARHQVSKVLRWKLRLHHRWPAVFPEPGLSETLEFHRSRDVEKNAESALPDGLEIRLEAIWVVEVYPPTLIRHLYQDLDRLDWNKDPDKLDQAPVSDFITQQRDSTHGGGWINLGLILRPTDSRFLGGHRRAKLPAGVDHAMGGIHFPTASLAVVVITFVLDASCARGINDALTRTYRTEARRVGVGYSFDEPPERRKIESRLERARVRSACRNWIAQSLHGTFSEDQLRRRHPCAELVTANSSLLIGEKDDKIWSPRMVLGFDREWSSWESQGDVLVRMSIESTEDTGADVVLNVDRNLAVSAATTAGYGMPEPAQFLDHRVSAFMAIWSLHRLFGRYETGLAKIRDSLLESAKRSDRRGALKRLRDLHDVVLSASPDVRVITTDVEELTKDAGISLRGSFDFKAMDTRFNGEGNFLEVLLTSLALRAHRMRDRESQLQDLLVVDATTKNAIASMELQWRVGFLGILIALAGVVIAVLQLRR